MKSNPTLDNAIYLGASPKLFELSRNLRNNMTPSERILWKKLSSKQMLGYKFRRQHPILSFIVDFYCHKAKLVIEVDGAYHNEKHQKEYDLGRSDELELHGIKVMRFTNEEVKDDLDRVIKVISDYLMLL